MTDESLKLARALMALTVLQAQMKVGAESGERVRAAVLDEIDRNPSVREAVANVVVELVNNPTRFGLARAAQVRRR